MSSVSETRNGGNYRLSGRRSIHNHGTDCPFWNCEAMGRYGLNTQRRQEQGTSGTPQDGTDEVDNVMSKMARASSPMTTRKQENYRRNSLNMFNRQKENYTDDSDDNSNLLSKSSPAIFSPYSCCSEEAEGLNSTNYTNESANSSTSQNILNTSRTSSSHNTSSQNPRNLRRNIDKENFYKQSPKKSTCMLYTSIIITALVAVAIAYYNIFSETEPMSKIIYDKYSFYNDVRGVGNKYNVGDSSILQVRAGIATIFERQDTGSFIFAYNSGRRNFNSEDFNNFVSELASAAAKYLRNHTQSVQHVVVDTSNLQVQSDKELMNEYAKDVDKTGVMLVKDLDKVPSAIAMAFHYYCDEYNPLVKKSAIFFTLNVARCSNVSNEKYTHDVIEKCLTEKWVKMPTDNIRPLLNRVVNVVIDVTSDF